MSGATAGGWCRVDSVTPSKDAWYRWHVRGFNRDTGESFAWSVPDLDWPGFDVESLLAALAAAEGAGA